MREARGVALALLAVAAFQGGCSKPGPIKVTAARLLVQERTSGAPSLADQVRHGQLYRVAVQVSWLGGSAGRHQRTWTIYRGGEPLRSDQRSVSLRTSPFTFRFDADSGAEPPGEYRVQLRLDGETLATVEVPVVP